MLLERSAGVLLHPTSLPNGVLDDEAYRFVDWLAAAGQSWWQLLPLGPPDDLGSPYRTPSAFAASPQLLAKPDARVTAGEIEEFVATHAFWAGGWAAHAGRGALADQVRFQREWRRLRAYAAERGVRIIGDIPIYVADDGADVATWPELFVHGEVAGAPPDALSRTGQLWGNPLYDWPAHRASGYRWWIERFRRTFELVDLARIDHFRGFVSYWAVPAGRKTAKNGHWRRAPGHELFAAAEAALGDLPLIAEDLGVITSPVCALRDELGLPGMVVLHWAFGGSERNPHAVRNHRENHVVYTSTHDTNTTVGWFEEELTKRQRAATGLDGAAPSWGLIELAMSSRAALAIVPLQDVLGLGSEARMNRPGIPFGNWAWRLDRVSLTRERALRLRDATERGGRLAGTVRAAGGVVARNGRLLLVHRPTHDDWTFPKGKREPGESDEECALREVREETGLECRLQEELAATDYVDAHGRPKRVRWWRMRVVGGEFAPTNEVDEVRWVAPTEARQLLTYPRDLALLG